MSEQMKTWNKVKTPPGEALKEIKGGRLKGFTDIDPMWRFQIMTETFGQVGVGWIYEIVSQWLETPEKDPLNETQDICAFTNIKLKYRTDANDSGWSEWIPGIGGSKFATKEKHGIHISDECYKMSLTDALSVAMKAIGVGADVYMGKLSHNGTNGAAPQSKYSGANDYEDKKKFITCPDCGKDAVIEGKKQYGGGYVCWKKEGGCGAKFKTLDAITNPAGERIAALVENIFKGEREFKKIGKPDEYKKVLDEFKIDVPEDIIDEGIANKVLLRLSTVIKMLKIENNEPIGEQDMTPAGIDNK